jgi:hypothetical protein
VTVGYLAAMVLVVIACMVGFDFGVVAIFAVARMIAEWRYRRVVKIWLEVPKDAPVQAVMPTLLRLAKRYEGGAELVVFPQGCRDIEGKRLTLAWGFRPCADLLAVLRELGTVTIGA